MLQRVCLVFSIWYGASEKLPLKPHRTEEARPGKVKSHKQTDYYAFPVAWWTGHFMICDRKCHARLAMILLEVTLYFSICIFKSIESDNKRHQAQIFPHINTYEHWKGAWNQVLIQGFPGPHKFWTICLCHSRCLGWSKPVRWHCYKLKALGDFTVLLMCLKFWRCFNEWTIQSALNHQFISSCGRGTPRPKWNISFKTFFL